MKMKGLLQKISHMRKRLIGLLVTVVTLWYPSLSFLGEDPNVVLKEMGECLFNKSSCHALSAYDIAIPYILFAIIFTFALLVSYVYINFFWKNIRKSYGGPAGPVRSKIAVKEILPLTHRKIARNMHDFTHILYEYSSLFRHAEIGSNEHKNMIKRFLQQIALTMSNITGLMYSAHIKVFENDDGREEPQGLSYNNKFMFAYQRVPSEVEEKLTESYPKRRNSEKFRIIRGEEGKARNLSAYVQNKGNIDENRVNSAYNDIFCDQDHFYINNDLESASPEEYYSNSANYLQYYKSVAIFPISKNIDPSNEVQKSDKIYGLLILDSPFTGAFPYEATCAVLGYFAHRLYDVFATKQQTN